MPVTPRTFMFGAKAAPGYVMAKRIIKLIHNLARVINTDPDVQGRLKIVFPANFNVSLAERIYPAADMSEQISLAGKEASGTGNMKFALNGAITVGTLDGANVEIRERVGAENFFLFGLDADEVRAGEAQGYDPLGYYEHDGELKAAIDAMAIGTVLRRRSRTCSARSSTRCSSTTSTCCWPISARTSTRPRKRPTSSRTATAGPACRSSIRRGPGSSLPTARSANTATRSGT